jgi:hypothetical protein
VTSSGYAYGVRFRLSGGLSGFCDHVSRVRAWVRLRDVGDGVSTRGFYALSLTSTAQKNDASKPRAPVTRAHRRPRSHASTPAHTGDWSALSGRGMLVGSRVTH